MRIIHRINIVEAGNEYRRVKKGTTLHCARGSPQQANLAHRRQACNAVKLTLKVILKKKKKKKKTGNVTQIVVPRMFCGTSYTRDLLEQHFTAQRDTKCSFTPPQWQITKQPERIGRSQLFFPFLSMALCSSELHH